MFPLVWGVSALLAVAILGQPGARLAAPRERYPGRPLLYRVLVHWFTRRELHPLRRFGAFRQWDDAPPAPLVTPPRSR